jgi:hypothetical protein
MRAITLIQPWASAVVRLGKRIENRLPSSPCAHVGSVLDQRVAIHAGLKYDPYTPDYVHDELPIDDLPRGAIIGLARVVGAVHGFDAVAAAVGVEQAQKWYAGDKHVAVLLGDVAPLPEPIPCPGALGWWRVPHHIMGAIHRQFFLSKPERET